MKVRGGPGEGSAPSCYPGLIITPHENPDQLTETAMPGLIPRP